MAEPPGWRTADGDRRAGLLAEEEADGRNDD